MERTQATGDDPRSPSTDPEPRAAAPRRAARPKVARPLLKLIARSLVRVLVMLFLVATVTFVAIRAMPGNPVDVWVQDLQDSGLTAAQAQAHRVLKIDLDQSLGSQYLDYMNNLVHGDLGDSIILSPGTPVTEMLSG